MGWDSNRIRLLVHMILRILLLAGVLARSASRNEKSWSPFGAGAGLGTLKTAPLPNFHPGAY